MDKKTKNKKINKQYKQILALKARYLNLFQDNKSLINILNEVEVSEHVYNSNAIENSTLSLEETEKILMQLDLDRYINQREIFEAKNLARVVEYIEDKSKEKELDLEMILFLHKMLISNIRDEIAGRFRNDKEWVRIGSYIAVSPLEILDRLNKMFLEYQISDENIVKKITLFHLTFEYIHPFVDGNGRIGRVLNNYLLMREKFISINIKFIDRAKYYSGFVEFQSSGKTEIMEKLVGLALLNSYHKRLAYLEGKKIISLSEYAKQSAQSLSNVINKAKRQTIEAFVEKGVWKIGVN